MLSPAPSMNPSEPLAGRIHSVETCGTVDGPGVRMVVFFQGCPMRCLYCHNPDTWKANAGDPMTAAELLRLFERNRPFYKHGGITATGGEPMLQLGFLTELFTVFRQAGVHTCLDTSGICFDPAHPEPAAKLLSATDLVMLDIKHIDSEKHRELTGHPNGNILAFARFIADSGVPLWIRHVIVPGWTDSPEEQEKLGYFIGGLKTLKAVDVLPYHNMGKTKYEALGLPYLLADTPPATQEAAETARKNILRGVRKKLLELRT